VCHTFGKEYEIYLAIVTFCSHTFSSIVRNVTGNAIVKFWNQIYVCEYICVHIYVYFYIPVCSSVCRYIPTPHNLYRWHNFSTNYKILLHVAFMDFSPERESELFIHFTRQFVRSSNCSSPVIHLGSILLGNFKHWPLLGIWLYLFNAGKPLTSGLYPVHYVYNTLSFYVINSRWIVRKFLSKYLAMFLLLKKKIEMCLWNRLSMCMCTLPNNFWKLETLLIKMAYIFQVTGDHANIVIRKSSSSVIPTLNHLKLLRCLNAWTDLHGTWF
jgi:hypothetical protein